VSEEDIKQELKKAEGIENTLKILINSVKDIEQKKLQSINDALGYLQSEKARTEEFVNILNALKVQLTVVELMKEEAEDRFNTEREASKVEIDEVAQLIGDVIDAHDFTLKCIAKGIPGAKIRGLEDWGYEAMKNGKILGAVHFASIAEHRVLTKEEICSQVQKLKERVQRWIS